MTAMLFNTRMDIYEIRRVNFLKLLEKSHSDREFADATASTPSHVSQMKTGHRPIGDQVARRIEDKLHLEHGWMDQLHIEESELPEEEREIKALADAIAAQPSDKLETIKAALKLVGVTLPIPGQPLVKPDLPKDALIVTDPVEKQLVESYRVMDDSARRMTLAAANAATSRTESQSDTRKKNHK
jgi:hypothetical protein